MEAYGDRLLTRNWKRPQGREIPLEEPMIAKLAELNEAGIDEFKAFHTEQNHTVHENLLPPSQVP